MMHPIAHFRTISEHRHLVCRYCLRLGLIRQGLTHDLSKYSPEEFWRGARYYQGYRSPNDAERAETGMSRAWLHHKGRNKHHFEYWIDWQLNPEGGVYYAGNKMDEQPAAGTVLRELAHLFQTAEGDADREQFFADFFTLCARKYLAVTRGEGTALSAMCDRG